jgi:hypothetical protein
MVYTSHISNEHGPCTQTDLHNEDSIILHITRKQTKRNLNIHCTSLNSQTLKTHRKDGSKPTKASFQNSKYLLILSLYDDERCTSGLRQLTRQGTASSAPVQFSFMDDSFPEPMDLKEEHPS